MRPETTDELLLYHFLQERLEILQRSHYPEQGRYKQLYAEATNCLREYLNR